MDNFTGETFTKRFIYENGNTTPELDLFLEKAGWIEKSSATKVSEFQIHVGTFQTTGNYKYNVYGFALNEIEAEFDYNNGDMLSLTLRDTSVNKKIEFTKKTAVFTYTRGRDTVGQHSEMNYLTTREPIVNIKINGKQYQRSDTGIDMEQVYKDLTGLDLSFLTEDDLEEERENSNLWFTLLQQVEDAS